MARPRGISVVLAGEHGFAFQTRPAHAGGAQMVDLATIELVTFDCFGTLVDWRQPLAWLGLDPTNDFAAFERASRDLQDPNRTFLPYRTVLANVAEQLAPRALSVKRQQFSQRFGLAPPFVDHAALPLMQSSVRIGTLSNSDARHQLDVCRTLGVTWDVLVLAESVGGYKPQNAAWDAMVSAVERDTDIARDRWLHVSAFAEYDLIPARARGLRTCFLRRPGVGDDRAEADVSFDSLHALAAAIGAAKDGPVVCEIEVDVGGEWHAAEWVQWMLRDQLARGRMLAAARSATLDAIDETHFRISYTFASRADVEVFERDASRRLYDEAACKFPAGALTYRRRNFRSVARR